MKISVEQLEKIAAHGCRVTPTGGEVDEAVIRLTDGDLIAAVAARVAALPDRDDAVASLRARIADGSYRPAADEIADAIVRRAVADRVR